MAGFDKERETLEAYFKAQFKAVSDWPVQYQNIPFTEPADGKFVRFTILNGESTRRSLGENPNRRHPGAVMIQIFVPDGGGTKSAREIADKIEPLFADKSIQSGTSWISFDDVSIVPVGKVENGRFQLNVSAPFLRDD
jgi:hypothetical protein